MLFLTGKAGTGKSTVLKLYTMLHPSDTIVLAPTGIAAINCGGVTIHSFFGLPFRPIIIADEEIKNKIVTEKPYRVWLKENMVSLENLPEAPHVHEPDHKTILLRQQAFGYTFEELRLILTPMGRDGVEGISAIKTAGGHTIAQNEKTSAIYGMNKLAVDQGLISRVLALEHIADELIRVMR